LRTPPIYEKIQAQTYELKEIQSLSFPDPVKKWT